MLLRAIVDRITGNLAYTRARLMGTKVVKLRQAAVEGGPAVLALSSHAWLSYSYLKKYYFQPLGEMPADSAAPFKGEKCQYGIALFRGKTLRILEPTNLNEPFTKEQTPLSYTPRKVLYHPVLRRLIILETEHNILDLYQRQKLRERAS